MATTTGTKIVLPPGRVVWGHPCKQRQRTDNNNKPIFKEDGSPAMQYIFGFAISKQEFGPVWQAMSAEAAKGFPQGTPQNFAWKYDDGDDTRPVNGGGAPYAQREGYPGNYVLTIASALDSPPPVFRFNPQTGGYDQVPANEIKTGDFFAIEINIVCNVPDNRSHTPSLYLNPTGLELVGYGKEIVSVAAINPMQAFGGRQHQLPPGASATPISSAPAGMGMPTGQQPMPQQQPMQPGPGGYAPQPQPMQQPGPGGYAPQPQFQQPAGPAGYPPPATDFIPGYPPQQQQQPAPQYGAPQPGFMPAGAQPMGAPAPMTGPAGYAATPGNPAMGYPSNPQQQPMQQPGGPAGYQQPMPGQMPPR